MSLTRRDLLLGGTAIAAGALVVGCTGEPDARPARVDPDLALRAAAVLRERELLAAYDAALVDHPALRAVLAPLREDHAVHLARLEELTDPVMSPTPSAPPVVAPVKDAPAARRTALRGQERAAQAAHRDAAITASRSLAPLLASLAACEASHAALL